MIGVALAAFGLAIAYATVTTRLAGRIALPVDDAYLYFFRRADSPSVTWQAVLAVPGAIVKGHALVTAAFWIGAVLYALAIAGCFAVARRIGGTLAGLLAAIAALSIAPFAWSALAGLDVAITAACWVGALWLFARRETPGILLSLLLVALGLARQEAIVVVAAIALAGAWHTATTRGLILWLVPLLPAIAWRVIAVRGDPVIDLAAVRGDGLPLAIAFAALWLIGVVRGWRNPIVVVTPILYLLFGLGPAAFPVFAITVGCAASATDRAPRASIAGGFVAAAALAGLAILPLRASLVQFAQDAADLDRRIAPFEARFAEASVIAAHDPSAVAFYSGVPTVALDGSDPREGPGARFERLERLERPSHFISCPTALGFDALFGEVRAIGRAGPKLGQRSWMRGDVQWIEADWDRVHSGERPLTPHPGWRIVDRIDVADLADEAAHHWRAEISGKQATLLHRDIAGITLDGGRTVTGGERFAIDVDPAKPARLILRTGGNRAYPDQDAVAAAALRIAGTPVAIPAPRGALVEVELELPAGQRDVTVATDHPYRVFHWFVLQRD